MKDYDSWCKICGVGGSNWDFAQVYGYTICCKCFKKAYLKKKRERHGRTNV